MPLTEKGEKIMRSVKEYWALRLSISLVLFMISSFMAVNRNDTTRDIYYIQHPYASLLGSVFPSFMGAVLVYFVFAPYSIRRFRERWVRCPHCDSLISARAKVCPRCQRDIVLSRQ